MTKLYSKPKCMTDKVTHYCPGCGHGIIHRLVAEVIDELGIQDKTIMMAPVGCAVLIYYYIDVDMVECSHGRAPAVASAIKRVRPENILISYQGDGDLAAIGTTEIVHNANRGENISVIFVNNAIYGMTGGQMAPTTLIGQKTATTPYGRDEKEAGKPIRVCEMLATLEGTYYLERTSVHDPVNVIKTKKAIKKAIQNQIDGKGFSLVEILSMCPTNWRVSVKKACEFVGKDMVNYFPLGVFKDKDQK